MLAKLLDYLEHFRCEECVDDNSLPGVYFRGVKDLFRQSGPTTLQRYSTLKWNLKAWWDKFDRFIWRKEITMAKPSLCLSSHPNWPCRRSVMAPSEGNTLRWSRDTPLSTRFTTIHLVSFTMWLFPTWRYWLFLLFPSLWKASQKHYSESSEPVLVAWKSKELLGLISHLRTTGFHHASSSGDYASACPFKLGYLRLCCAAVQHQVFLQSWGRGGRCPWVFFHNSSCSWTRHTLRFWSYRWVRISLFSFT